MLGETSTIVKLSHLKINTALNEEKMKNYGSRAYNKKFINV